MYQLTEVFPLENSKDRKQFVSVPYELYATDSNFAAQPRLSYTNLLKKSHPFFNTAKGRFWLLRSQQKIVGRIAGFINQEHNTKHNENVLFFGFFDCIDDPKASELLFNAVKEYANSIEAKCIRGPVNPSTNYEAACLIDGFDDPPQIMMTYNAPYYQNLIEGNGYEKSMDFYAFKRDPRPALPPQIEAIAKRAEEAHGITYRNISKKTWNVDLQIMRELYNKAWENNWGFVPMTPEEFDETAKELKGIVDEDLIIFVYAKGKPIGFGVGLPDYNQALIKLKKGRLTPIGIWHLLRAKKYMNRFRIITLGVLPEFRKHGIGALLYRKFHEAAKRKGFIETECSWILEVNQDMIKPLEKMGMDRYKTYRIYEQTI
ncbi:MAG: GNAT family N-acetyltransferase [Bacteriovoracaceae bacterium]